MITLETLRETRRKAMYDRNDKWAPIHCEINDLVASMLKHDPAISDKDLHESAEIQIEYVSIPLQRIEELAGFFRVNPEALDAYLAENEAEQVAWEVSQPKMSLAISREAALTFLRTRN